MSLVNSESLIVNQNEQSKSNQNTSNDKSRLDDSKQNEINKLDQINLDKKMDIDQSISQKEDQLIRVQLTDDLIDKLTKEDLIKKWKQQSIYIDSLEEKLKLELSNKEMFQDNEDKIKQQLFDLTRKENLLVMKLTTKEHEIQDYIKQIQELKLSQIASNDQLQKTFLDPAVNMIFEEMKKEVEKYKLKVEEIQNELSAWKFTPDSNTGKRLMAKCRLLYQENEELGKVISSGRIAKLEGELALQKSFSDEMKKSQGELDALLFELEEDVEGMQSTIYHLQQQLKEAKENLVKLSKEENQSNNIESNNRQGNGDESIVDIEMNNDSNKNTRTDDTINDNNLNDTSNDKLTKNSNFNQDLNEQTQIEFQGVESKVDETVDLVQKNGENKLTTNEINQVNDEEKANLERKRSLDEALEEVNASGKLMSDCGIGSIIKKRKLEQQQEKK